MAKRLGRSTVTRLDQARGSFAEPIVPAVPFELPSVERRLLEPIGTAEAIEHVIGDLVDDLVALLQARGIGLRTAVLTCLRVDGGEQRIGDRKSVVEGKSVSVRVDLGGRRIIKKKRKQRSRISID